MTGLFVILISVVIYAAVAFATFEKFTENGLVPRSLIMAFIFTPISIMLFYLLLTIKAPTKDMSFDYLKLATLRYPVGVGVFIERIYLRKELALPVKNLSESESAAAIVEITNLANTHHPRIWKKGAIAHAQ